MTNHRDRINDCLKGTGIRVTGSIADAHAEILTPPALIFVASLCRHLERDRQALPHHDSDTTVAQTDWTSNLQWQIELRDVIDGRIHAEPHVELGEDHETPVVRPRGWHRDETRMEVDGRNVPGSVFDFGLFFFHNVKKQLARGRGSYFYLPKAKSRLEKRLWDDLFTTAQDLLDVPRSSIRAYTYLD